MVYLSGTSQQAYYVFWAFGVHYMELAFTVLQVSIIIVGIISKSLEKTIVFSAICSEVFRNVSQFLKAFIYFSIWKIPFFFVTLIHVTLVKYWISFFQLGQSRKKNIYSEDLNLKSSFIFFLQVYLFDRVTQFESFFKLGEVCKVW